MKHTQPILQMVDTDSLQSMQDKCSKAMGLAFRILDNNCNAITEYSGQGDHYKLLGRLSNLESICQEIKSNEDKDHRQLYLYKFYIDMVGFVVPLRMGTETIAYIIGGQIRVPQEDQKGIENIEIKSGNTPINWTHGINDAYGNTMVMSKEILTTAALLFRDMVTLTLTQGATLDKDSSIERYENRYCEIQERNQSSSAKTGNEAIYSKNFLFIMNIITQLAFSEHASKTAEVCYDFVDAARYTMSDKKKISTIGEELDYIGCLLRIQNAWLSGNLKFRIDTANIDLNTICPFMIIQPIISAVLAAVSEANPNRQTIDISAMEIDNYIVVQVVGNGYWEDINDLENHLSQSELNTGFTITQVNSLIKYMFGEDCAISIGRMADPHGGSWISFKLHRTISN